MDRCCSFCSNVPSAETKSHSWEFQGRPAMMLASFCLVKILMLREAIYDLHSLDHRKLGDSFIHKFAATLVDTEAVWKV